MNNIIKLTRCLCGELMKREEVKDGEIPVCWKCQCDSEYEIARKKK